MSLRQLRSRAAQRLGFVLENTVALTEITQLHGLRLRLARVLAGIDAGLAHSLVASSDMNAEVFRDLREGDVRIVVRRHADHVVTEFLGERLGLEWRPSWPALSASRDRWRLFPHQPHEPGQRAITKNARPLLNCYSYDCTALAD